MKVFQRKDKKEKYIIYVQNKEIDIALSTKIKV